MSSPDSIEVLRLQDYEDVSVYLCLVLAGTDEKELEVVCMDIFRRRHSAQSLEFVGTEKAFFLKLRESKRMDWLLLPSCGSRDYTNVLLAYTARGGPILEIGTPTEVQTLRWREPSRKRRTCQEICNPWEVESTTPDSLR